MEAYLHTRILSLLRAAKKPVFISDERTDGDSLGASLAMADFLRGEGVRVPVYVSGPVPEKYRSMPNADLCTHDPAVFEDPEIDLVVVFDCSDARYVRDLVERLPRKATVINIDHHATNPLYGDVNQVVTDAPATAAVVHAFYEANRLVPSRDAATCLLIGICFDTTVFQNSATNPRALRAASLLMMSGARIQDVIRIQFHNRSVQALRLWGAALERLTRHPTLGTVSTFLTRQDIEENDASDEDVDGLSDFLSLASDAETLFVLRETTDGGVKVSMRSQSQNVANVARAFGGGGHVKAAGFTLPNTKFTKDDSGAWTLEHTA
jgi:phosphoesterase RecJ-like protein